MYRSFSAALKRCLTTPKYKAAARTFSCYSPLWQIAFYLCSAQPHPFALRAFVRLELNRLRIGLSWYEAKAHIIREAIRCYLAQPSMILPSTA